jgi:hypothetical protein
MHISEISKKKLLLLSRSFGRLMIPFHPKKNLKIFSDPTHHVFYGYYDKTPFQPSANSPHILSCHLPVTKFFFDNSKKLILGFYEDGGESFHFIDKTDAWSWQMGARLMWHPNITNMVCYNKFLDGSYKTIFYDLNENKISHQIDKASYDISSDGNFSLSLNFERLQKFRPGYGYRDKGNHNASEPSPANDGIFMTDIQSKKSDLIVSLEDICLLNPTDSMKNSSQYFNHISISPLSTGFIFLHLWDNLVSRSNRMFYYDLDSAKLLQVTENPVSHYAWKDDNHVLVTELYNNRYNYVLYNIITLKREILGNNLLFKDGHPSILNDGNYFICDSYRDKLGYQSLFLYDILNNSKKNILKTYIPNKFDGEYKCDLHPRLSSNNKTICIDMVSKGRRVMGLIPVDDIIQF